MRGRMADLFGEAHDLKGMSPDVDIFIDAEGAASILDTFSCLIQGIIPYGAQLLIAAGLAGISSASIIPHLYYPFLMGTMAVLSIIFRFPRNTVKPQARG